jgi:predicted ester cyclase
MMRGAFPDQRATVEDMLVDRDRVMTRTVITATHTGPLGKVPPWGKSIAVVVVDIWRVEDGHLKEHWGVLDNLSFMRQLGVIPPAAH